MGKCFGYLPSSIQSYLTCTLCTIFAIVVFVRFFQFFLAFSRDCLPASTTMASPAYCDVTAETTEVGKMSDQKKTLSNPDPAMDISHKHHHAHIHHSEHALQGRMDEVVYSIGTTAEKSTVPDQDPLDHILHRKHLGDKNGEINIADTEKGNNIPLDAEEDPQTHTFSRFYRRYRIFFHIFIWLLFTGLVAFVWFSDIHTSDKYQITSQACYTLFRQSSHKSIQAKFSCW